MWYCNMVFAMLQFLFFKNFSMFSKILVYFAYFCKSNKLILQKGLQYIWDSCMIKIENFGTTKGVYHGKDSNDHPSG